MGIIGVEEEGCSTPKLSLSRLPCKPKYPIEMLTPPLHPSLSIPFQWEEAPGKPRLTDYDQAATCFQQLDLPPSHQFTIMPSPPTAARRSLSLACTFSFRRRRMGGCASFRGSRRWNFKFREEERATFDLSQTLGDFLMTDKNKMAGIRITRVRSFFDFSTINSNLLDIYARFKQAIPWRRRR